MGIYVNQLGYGLDGEKRAVLSFRAERFQVADEEGKVWYEGETRHFGHDRASGDDVTVADFSDFRREGRYRVVAAGQEASPFFQIGDGVYDPLLADLMRAYYYLRCGCELKAEHAGKFTHKACHVGTVLRWEDVDGKDIGKSFGEGGKYVTAKAPGGWHDAGDYGRYVTAGACALAHLLFAWQLYPEVFRGRTWNIPESGNGTPDLLNECRVELEWFLKMQREDGGVYHKLTTARHAAFVMPEKDLGQLYFLPVSSMATADHAAICALAARIYLEFDAEFAERLERAARKSYEWLRKNPDFLGFRNPEGCGTGEYGEWSDSSNRFWAAAELYALTGEESYHEDLKKALEKPFPLAALGYGEVGGFGALSYLTSGRKLEEGLRERFLDAFAKEAAIRVRASEECGYGVANAEWEYGWGSNMGVMVRGMIFAIAEYLGLEKRVQEAAKDAELPPKWRRPGEPEEPFVQGPRERRSWTMRDHAATQLDYLLGCNALGISYVTGNGENACRYPHLRPAHADGIEECIPGMVSGGPNRRPADEVGKRLVPPGTPAMKSYLDRYECYSLNEITIYWNSPAVFVTAYLMAKA